MWENFLILSYMYRWVRELNLEISRISARHGLTFGQFSVLEALERKGAMTVGEIKKTILSSDGTVPVIIENLIKMGLVTKTKILKDKRYSTVDLTQKGREVIQKAGPENKRMIHERLSLWNETEKKILLVLLDKYIANR